MYFENHGLFFSRQGICAWNNRFCWPGTCSNSLTNTCACAAGFSLVNTSSETTCQPNQLPTIETCTTTFTAKNGDKVASKSSSNSRECNYFQDVYGNFQIAEITYKLFTQYRIKLSLVSRPKFIKESNFGITDTTVFIKKRLLSGK